MEKKIQYSSWYSEGFLQNAWILIHHTKNRAFVLCFPDGKETEGFARSFSETHLTSDQIIEHFFLKNNVQM